MNTRGIKSPKSPRNSLKEAIDASKKLFSEASRAFISREAAANALGYSGLTGSSLTLLASMSGYGLLAKQGTDVRVSDKAIQILHPLGESEKTVAIRAAALTPPLFAELFQTHGACSAKIIESKLVQNGFAPDAARKTAGVFSSNIEFAGLKSDAINSREQEEIENDDSDAPSDSPPPSQSEVGPLTINLPTSHVITRPNAGNLTKEYRFPLDDENEVELKFYGTTFGLEQLDALQDTVEFLKKQLGRRKPAI